MSIEEIRQRLHEIIDSAEVKKLKALYTLLENDITHKFPLTIAQKEELDKRYNDYQHRIGKTYTWEETVALSDKALADRKKQ